MDTVSYAYRGNPDRFMLDRHGFLMTENLAETD